MARNVVCGDDKKVNVSGKKVTELLGKKKFEELLSGLIAKPPGKPTLVPNTDKRPAMSTAKDDFKEN